MKKQIILHCFILIVVFLAILAIFKKDIFTYQFDKRLIDRFYCSQDMPQRPLCKQHYILSDSDLHIAVGYLYATGTDPAEINFQHMPLVAYLYGYSILATGNPFYVEMFFQLALILLTYYLGIKLFKSPLAALTAGLLLTIDPLFLSLTTEASYEPAQAVFMISYLISMVFLKSNIFLSGLLLGLMSTTKFWGGALFFVILIAVYGILIKKFILKQFIGHLIVTAVVFSLVYLKSFINRQGMFNIIFFQLKVLKYWLDHSVTNIPLASLLLFTTGFFKSWWDNFDWLRTQPWSILWPIGLLISIKVLINEIKKYHVSPRLLLAAIPISYLLYLGIQAPFSRYFILIIPFTYLFLADYIIEKFRS